MLAYPTLRGGDLAYARGCVRFHHEGMVRIIEANERGVLDRPFEGCLAQRIVEYTFAAKYTKNISAVGWLPCSTLIAAMEQFDAAQMRKPPQCRRVTRTWPTKKAAILMMAGR